MVCEISTSRKIKVEVSAPYIRLQNCCSEPQRVLTSWIGASLGSSVWRHFYSLIGTVQTGPRIFWKEHQHRFPALANLARDIFSIPATGADVERLFNSARDVCHYRRGSLSPRTIRDLLYYLISSCWWNELSQTTLISLNNLKKHIWTKHTHIYDLLDGESGGRPDQEAKSAAVSK